MRPIYLITDISLAVSTTLKVVLSWQSLIFDIQKSLQKNLRKKRRREVYVNM
jgi:hypothetical protein